MAWAYRITSEFNSASASSAAVSKPGGVVDDDIMIAVVMHETEYSNAVPSGWTSLGQATSGALGLVEVFWKLASSEGASWTWGFATANKLRVLIYFGFGGFDTSNPILATSNTPYTTSDTIARAADVSTGSFANAVILHIATVKRTLATTFSPPSSPGAFDEDYDGGSTAPDFWNGISSLVWTGSGSTGDMDATISVSLASKHAFAVILRPTGGAPSVPSPVSTLALMGVG